MHNTKGEWCENRAKYRTLTLELFPKHHWLESTACKINSYNKNKKQSTRDLDGRPSKSRTWISIGWHLSSLDAYATDWSVDFDIPLFRKTLNSFHWSLHLTSIIICYLHATHWISVSILTFPRSMISRQKQISSPSWPWRLTFEVENKLTLRLYTGGEVERVWERRYGLVLFVKSWIRLRKQSKFLIFQFVNTRKYWECQLRIRSILKFQENSTYWLYNFIACTVQCSCQNKPNSLHNIILFSLCASDAVSI